MIRKLIRNGVLAAVVLAVSALGGGCKGGGGPRKPPTTASLSLTITTDFIGRGVCGTTGGAYELVPERLTGTTGIDYTLTRSFDATGVTHGDECHYPVHATLGTGGLRPGVWKIRIVTPTWTASCTETLHAGQNFKTFTKNGAGCR